MAGADPVPIGLIASSVGGTTIQQWLPPWANNNATCSDNNCGCAFNAYNAAPARCSRNCNPNT